MSIYFNDARHAVHAAIAVAPACVAWVRGKGFRTYDPREGCPEGVPELFVAGSGSLPVPLSDEGSEVLASMLQAAANELVR
jgi:hypothetical protein